MKLTGPESALVGLDFYYEYLDSTEHTTEFNLIGSVLYNENETTDDYTRLDVIMDNYLHFDIQKFFGLNISEFIKLNRYESNKLIRLARKRRDELRELAQSVTGDDMNVPSYEDTLGLLGGLNE